jgi:sugar phosphate isomerase/epimerase
LGVQLFMVRADMDRDPARVFARLAEIGYREVEFWRHHGRTPAALRAMLDAAGLTAPSTHVGLDALDGDAAARTLDAARTLGHRFVTVGWIEPRDRVTLDAWRRVAERLNSAGERVRAAGLQLAYHNHGYDSAMLEGGRPIDILTDRTDARLVELQLDVFWLLDGGGDPAAFSRRWGRRITSLHFKDRGPNGEQVDIGAGTIDWRAVLRANPGARHFFLDVDDPPDPYATLRASYARLRPIERG